MEIDYKINKSLFGFNGILNRRNFIANYFLINAITTSIFVTPLLVLFFVKPSLLRQIIGIVPYKPSFVLFVIFWLVCYCCLKFGWYYLTILRRMRDILGENREIKAHILTILLSLLILTVELSSRNVLLLQYFTIAVVVCLMCIEGNISSKLPKETLPRFNWGAFLGTWIWGLFNKSYKTLWGILLFFTPGFFNFAIYCGLKGNEWAYKNQQIEEEKFHNNQRMQTTIWAFVAPVLNIIIWISLLFTSISGFSAYLKTHPQYRDKLVGYYVEVMALKAQTTFEEIKLDNNEYRFVINPKVWNTYSDNEKYSLFNSAGSYIIYKKSLKPSIDAPIEELEKIKIYSSFNNEILGEFQPSQDMIKDKGKVQNIKDGLKFNEHPSLP